MSGVEDRSGVEDTLEVRVRAAFAEVAVDDEARERVLASVCRRARPAGGLQSMRASAVRIAIMFVAMAAILAALFFRGARMPVDVPIRSNTPWPAEKIASAVDFPVAWLSPRYEDMRFTDTFSRTENEPDITSWANPDNATVEADHSRPTISSLQVVAEYSPSGKSAAHDKKQTTPGIKVISMPRTDPSGWEKAFRKTQGNLSGDAKSAEIAWTTVGTHKALRLRHEWQWGNGTPKGHVTMSVEYLAIDFGDSTVMLQGVDVPPGVLEKAADALTWIR